MDVEYVDYQAWKYVYTVRMEVQFAGATSTTVVTKIVVSDYELGEEEVIEEARESTEFDSISGSEGSSGRIVAILSADVILVRIRRDFQ